MTPQSPLTLLPGAPAHTPQRSRAGTAASPGVPPLSRMGSRGSACPRSGAPVRGTHDAGHAEGADRRQPRRGLSAEGGVALPPRDVAMGAAGERGRGSVCEGCAADHQPTPEAFRPDRSLAGITARPFFGSDQPQVGGEVPRQKLPKKPQNSVRLACLSTWTSPATPGRTFSMRTSYGVLSSKLNGDASAVARTGG